MMTVVAEGEPYPRIFGSYLLLAPITARWAAGAYFAVRAGGERDGLCMVKRKHFPRPGSFDLKALTHPNIVRTLGHDRIKEDVFVAVELIEGRDLLSVWNRAAELRMSLPLDLGVAVAGRILDALSAAQAARIFHHGQLCPAKVMLTIDGRTKLTEFQLAQAILQPTVHGSSRAPIVIRPGYAAPEQVQAGGSDAAGDIFAVGVLLWELLVQKALFPVRPTLEAGARMASTLIKDIREDLAEGRQLAPSQASRRVPRALDDVVVRALATSPSHRFQTFDAFRAALRPFERPQEEQWALIARMLTALFGPEPGLTSRDRSKLLAAARAPLAGATVAIPVGPRPAPRSRPPEVAQLPTDRRWRRLVVGATLLVVAAVAGALVVLTPSRSGTLDRRDEVAAPPSGSGPERATTVVATTPTAPVVRDVRADVPRAPAATNPVPESTGVMPPPGPQAPPADRHPSHPAGTTRGKASATDLVTRAQAAFEAGDIETSLSLASRAAKLGGGEDAYLIVGDTSLKKGDRSGAVRAYTAALKLNPSSHAAQRGLARARDRTDGHLGDD